MSRLARLPTPLSRWLGYRPTPPPKQPQHIVWLWSWIGAFCGISLIQAVFGQAHYFIERGVPSIVASYGASAVLIYGAIEAPLAQPRALFGGHFLGALVGICITKLFHLLPTEERFEELVWLAGSLACATAVVVMQVTETTHPPAGNRPPCSRQPRNPRDRVVLPPHSPSHLRTRSRRRIDNEQHPTTISCVLVYACCACGGKAAC